MMLHVFKSSHSTFCFVFDMAGIYLHRYTFFQISTLDFYCAKGFKPLLAAPVSHLGRRLFLVLLLAYYPIELSDNSQAMAR